MIKFLYIFNIGIVVLLSAPCPAPRQTGKTPANPSAYRLKTKGEKRKMMSNDEFFRAGGGLFAGKSKTYGNSGERK